MHNRSPNTSGMPSARLRAWVEAGQPHFRRACRIPTHFRCPGGALATHPVDPAGRGLGWAGRRTGWQRRRPALGRRGGVGARVATSGTERPPRRLSPAHPRPPRLPPCVLPSGPRPSRAMPAVDKLLLEEALQDSPQVRPRRKADGHRDPLPTSQLKLSCGVTSPAPSLRGA